MKRNRAPFLRRAVSFEVGALAIIAVIILAAAFSLAYRPLAPSISQATVSSSQSSSGLAQLPLMTQPPTSTTSTTSTSPAIAHVTILPGASYPNSTGYSPDTITVVIGVNNTVEWVNNETAPHTVTATDHSFDSGNLSPGDTWTYTFTKPGTYTYVCTYHPWMKGTVIVVSS